MENSNLSDLSASDGVPLRQVSDKEVRDAQLTMVELCDFGEGEISRDEMADLIDMITPTMSYRVSVLSNFDA